MTYQRRTLPWLRPVTLVLSVVLALGAACGGDDDSATRTEPKATPASSTTARKLSGDITVLAAASLTGAFTEIGQAFEAANPGTGVTFSFAGSSALALQANSGAPADVFASADDVNMGKVTDAGNASMPKAFARNRLAIVVQKNNPLSIKGLTDFNRSDVIYVICKEGVPCGTYAQEALSKGGVTRREASQEADVKSVVTKVTTNQADAGIAYVTDAKAAAANSETIDIPDALNVIASYPIATLRQSGKPAVANAFIDFVISSAGQSVLAKYGFLTLE